MTEQRKVALSTGIGMNVALAGSGGCAAGDPDPRLSGIAPDLAAIVPLLDDGVRLVMPDLRGFGEATGHRMSPTMPPIR